MSETKIRKEQVEQPTDTRMRAYLSSNEAVVANVIETLIFDTEIYDIGSNYNNATGEFTVPEAGLYYMGASMRILVAADQDDIALTINVNGTAISSERKSAAGIQRESRQTTSIRYLSANDVITVTAVNISHDDTIESGDTVTWFEVVRIS